MNEDNHQIRRSKNQESTCTLAKSILLLTCIFSSACETELDSVPSKEPRPAMELSPDVSLGSNWETEELQRGVSRVVHRHIAQTANGLQGAGLAIVHKDEGLILHKSFGNFEGEEPFLVASLSKVVDAGIILSLQDKGEIGLDMQVRLPGSTDGTQEAFTFEQLLSNSSGLPCSRVAGVSNGALCQFDGDTTLANCAKSIMEDPQTLEHTILPDSEYCYGGRQWQVLGAAAEAVTGRSWHQLFYETYVEPCGLVDSGFVNQFSDPIAKQTGWSMYPNGVNIQELSRSNPNIEGGFYTTLSDFSRILLMQLRGGVCEMGRVMSQQSVNRWLEDRINQAFSGSIGAGFHIEDLRVFGQGYGLGWWIDRETGQRSVPGAYGSTAWVSPDRSYAAIVATKSNGATGRAIFDDLRQEIHRQMTFIQSMKRKK